MNEHPQTHNQHPHPDFGEESPINIKLKVCGQKSKTPTYQNP